MKAPLASLVANLVDYAGLFPPAKLPMGDTVRNYVQYLGAPEREMLGRLIIPVSRLDEFHGEREKLTTAPLIPISALGGSNLEDELANIDRFNESSGSLATVDAFETKATTRDEIARIGRTTPLWLTTYVELPIGDSLHDLVATTARYGLRAKIRTGGVTPDAFPEAAKIAEFIAVCAQEGVAFKATAGLHHPVRCVRPLTYEPDSVSGTMHGFLNVFLAATFIREDVPVEKATQLLLEDDASTIEVMDEAIRWRDETMTRDQILRARRTFAIAFGSCSFEEPVDDLRQIGLL